MILTFVLATVIALLLMGLLAPYETLGWWGGWYGDRIKQDLQLKTSSHKKILEKKHYVVYLTGIGGTSPTEYSHLEKVFLATLEKQLPEVSLVTDVFPYASSNLPLTDGRSFSWFWRILKNTKTRGRLGILAFIINIRNLWQVLVSSDRRFGPIYNTASAQIIYNKLLANGYSPDSGIPVTLIGYSGGGQISTGAAPLLKETIAAPVHVLSLGGVMSSNERIMELDSLTHFYGSKDSTQRLGYIMFPARYPLFSWTAWNRARQEGIITRENLGPMVHTGARGYLDHNTKLSNGQSYLDKTVEMVIKSLSKNV